MKKIFCADSKNIYSPANAVIILVQFYTILLYTHVNNIQITCSDFYGNYVCKRNSRIPDSTFFNKRGFSYLEFVRKHKIKALSLKYNFSHKTSYINVINNTVYFVIKNERK